MTPAQNRHVYSAGIVAVIIVLLLMAWRGRNTNVTNVTQKPGDVLVSPTIDRYDVAPLRVPNGDFDWMQTTNLACDCDEGYTQPFIAGGTDINVAYPIIVYASQPAFFSTPINPVFEIYQPPPLPTWHFDVLRDVNMTPHSIIKTSTGELFRRSQNQTFSQNTHRPSEYELSGVNLYFDAIRFIHDASLDVYPPSLPNIMSGG